MDLNQTTLRGILAQILSNSLKVNEAYIVPKQGNWWNPQEALTKPDTWCAYVIRSNKPVTAPYFSKGESGQQPVNRAMVDKIATIDLQFVGPQAETIAQSVALWPHRVDVAAAFATVQGAVMYTDMDARSASFYQDGANNVLSWNTSIKVHWVQELDTSQGLITGADITGTIHTLPPTR